MSILDRSLAAIFGTKHERDIKAIQPLVLAVNEWEPKVAGLSDADLRAKTPDLKGRLEAMLETGLRTAGGPHGTPARGLRHRARGRQAGPGHAPLRRPAHRRHGPPRGQDRRDEDGRGQDPRGGPPRLPQRPRGQGRPRGHRERLPGPPRRRVDGPGLPLPGPHRGLHPAGDGQRGAPGGLRLRHHLRPEQRVRLRLPPRQHEVPHRGHGPAGPPLRHRGRGGLHPHRRGPDPAHHLGPQRRAHRQVLRRQQHHPQPPEGEGLRRWTRSSAPRP